MFQVIIIITIIIIIMCIWLEICLFLRYIIYGKGHCKTKEIALIFGLFLPVAYTSFWIQQILVT
jgi:hypothetical protein